MKVKMISIQVGAFDIIPTPTKQKHEKEMEEADLIKV